MTIMSASATRRKAGAAVAAAIIAVGAAVCPRDIYPSGASIVASEPRACATATRGDDQWRGGRGARGVYQGRSGDRGQQKCILHR